MSADPAANYDASDFVALMTARDRFAARIKERLEPLWRPGCAGEFTVIFDSNGIVVGNVYMNLRGKQGTKMK